MLMIAIGNAAVYIVDLFGGIGELPLSGYLFLAWPLVKAGQIWRLITFVFIPPSSIHWLLTPVVIYFYYWLGKTLEAEWGALKLTVFYLSGMLITIAASAFPTAPIVFGADLNLSLFLAVATLFPDVQIRLYFLIPIKMKWLALVSVAFVVYSVTKSHSWMPLVPMVNYLIYFGPGLIRSVSRQKNTTHKTLEFRTELRRAKKVKGYLHKCAVCGVTDTDRPDMEFRYCSLCASYECYCQEHIKNHTHK